MPLSKFPQLLRFRRDQPQTLIDVGYQPNDSPQTSRQTRQASKKGQWYENDAGNDSSNYYECVTSVSLANSRAPATEVSMPRQQSLEFTTPPTIKYPNSSSSYRSQLPFSTFSNQSGVSRSDPLTQMIGLTSHNEFIPIHNSYNLQPEVYLPHSYSLQEEAAYFEQGYEYNDPSAMTTFIFQTNSRKRKDKHSSSYRYASSSCGGHRQQYHHRRKTKHENRPY